MCFPGAVTFAILMCFHGEFAVPLNNNPLCVATVFDEIQAKL